jgi:hypothetical protein
MVDTNIMQADFTGADLTDALAGAFRNTATSATTFLGTTCPNGRTVSAPQVADGIPAAQRGRQRRRAVALARTFRPRTNRPRRSSSDSSADVTTARNSLASCSGAGRRYRTSSPAVT